MENVVCLLMPMLATVSFLTYLYISTDIFYILTYYCELFVGEVKFTALKMLFIFLIMCQRLAE